jgi:hypothetical protein
MGILFTPTKYFDLKQDDELTEKFFNEVLAENTERIQVHLYKLNLTEKGWKKLNDKIFKINPNIRLRLYSGVELDLSFLKNLPDLEILSIELHTIQNGLEIGKLKKLKSLTLISNQNDFSFFNDVNIPLENLFLGTNEAKNAKNDLLPILKFKNLKSLRINRYWKNLEKIVTELSELEELFLRSISGLKDINFIADKQKLQKLQLNSCGVNNYEPLRNLKNLKAFGLWKPTKLENLNFVSELTGLQYLFLQTVNNPTKFPNIDNLKKLKRVVLYSVKSVSDFTTLVNVKHLKEFGFYDIQEQKPEDFLPIIENKSIEKIYLWYFKTGLRNDTDQLLEKNGRQNKYVNYINDLDLKYE